MFYETDHQNLPAGFTENNYRKSYTYKSDDFIKIQFGEDPYFRLCHTNH